MLNCSKICAKAFEKNGHFILGVVQTFKDCVHSENMPLNNLSKTMGNNEKLNCCEPHPQCGPHRSTAERSRRPSATGCV